MLPKVGVMAVVEGMAKFQADSAKVNKSLGDIGTSTTRLGSIASGVTSKLTSLVGSLAKIGTIGVGVTIAGIGAGLYKAASTGLDFNNAMEQAGAKINAFTKDGAKTAELLEDIRLEAAKTPFEFQAMADATASLLPAAKQSGEAIMDLVKDAEVLAASNPAEGLEGAAFALREAVSGDFTSVIERFNLPRSMINQLKAEGVPALEIVRRTMNEMGFDMDLVSALANTASGRWSTFKDTLTNVAGTVTQPIFDALSGGLGDVNGWLAANEPMLTNMATLLAGQISEAITTVATKATELFAAFQAGGVKGLAGALGVPPETYDTIVNIATKVGELITTIAGYGGFGLAGILMVDPAAREALMTFLSDLWTWLSTNIPTAIQTVSDIWNNDLLPGFTEIADAVNAQLLPALQGLFDAFTGGTGGTQSFSDLWQNTLLPALTNVGAFVKDVLFPAWVDLEVFLVGALSTAITTLADYWTNYLFPAISAVSGFITGTVIPAMSDLWDWLGPKLGAAVQAMSDLWTGTLQPALITINSFIGENIIPLLVSLGNLFNAVVNKALTASAGLWQNILLPALKKVGDFLNATLFPVFQDVGKTVSEDVSPILKDLGETVLPILQEGLDYVTEAIKDVISFFDSLADKVSSFTLPDILTPGSPPPMAIAMMDIANATSAANVAIGDMMNSLASNKWDQIRGDVLDLVDDMQDEGFYASRGFGKSTGFAIKQAFIRAFTKNFQGILSGTITADALRALTQNEAGAYAERVTGDFGKIIARARQAGLALLSELKQELLEALPSFAGNLSGIAGQLGEFLQPEMDDRAKFIKKMQDFLASGSDELFRFDFAPALAGTDHVMLNRLRTQEQLNYLLAEQRKQEIEITKQKEAQQKLTFLQAQIDLIKIGRELGGNVFQGITFGLHASAEDLLRATNNVVEAMIGQIHTTLEIGSPSQIMVEVGQQIMAGLQRGIVSMTPTLNAQLSASVMGPLSPMMAGAMGGSSGDTYHVTNHFGQNTITTPTDMATFEARVLNVIRKNL